MLCKRYQYIFLPHFKVSEMVKGSPLGKRVSRDAMAAGHALLKRLLVQKGTRYGCTVMFVRTTIPRSACLLCVTVAVVVTCSVFKVFESVSLRVGCWRLVARPPPSR